MSKQQPLLSGSVPPKVLKAIKQMRQAHTHTVTRLELDLHGFGASMRTLREDADISLRDMARRIGVSAPFLSDCELGERRLSLEHTIKFITQCKP